MKYFKQFLRLESHAHPKKILHVRAQESLKSLIPEQEVFLNVRVHQISEALAA